MNLFFRCISTENETRILVSFCIEICIFLKTLKILMNDHKPIIEKIDSDNLMRFESFTEMEKYLNEKLLGQFESMKIIVGSQ